MKDTLYIFKKRLKAVLILSFSLSLVFSSFLVLRTIYRATGVAEPVTVIVASAGPDISDIQVVRISRGGAEFPIASVYRTQDRIEVVSREWFAGIKILSKKDLKEEIRQVDVSIGDANYRYLADDIVGVSSSSIEAIFSSQNGLVQGGDSKIFYFKNIINWSSDIDVVLIALMSNVWYVILFFFGVSMLFFSGFYLVEKIHPINVDLNEQKKRDNLFLILFSVILSVISIVSFVANSPTAFDWPTMDMGPFFMRHDDPTFLQNDFFTNSSSQPNPRFVFGYLILGVKTILSINWYEALFLFKVLLVVFTPPLIFLAVSLTLRKTYREERLLFPVLQFFVFIFALLSAVPYILPFFVVALWTPSFIISTPQSVSALFALLAMVLYGKKRWNPLAYFLWFGASVLHPAIGFSFLVFFVVLSAARFKRSEWFYLIVSGMVLPAACLFMVFSVKNKLSAHDFVYHYILANHSFHYLPSHFTSTAASPLPWYISSAAIGFLLIIAVLYSVKKKKRNFFIVSSLSFLSYVGCIVVEYVFVEKFPIKIFAELGPIRYSMVGYWLVAANYSYLFSLLIPKNIFRFLYGKTKVDSKKVGRIILMLSFFLVMFIFVKFKDDPFGHIRNDNKDLVQWVQHSTKEEDVFVSNKQGLVVDMSLVFRRPVFTGNGFPFREDDFIAYNERRFLVYGSPEDWKKAGGSWDGIKINNFYRELKPADFSRISDQYPLQYVIIEKDFSGAFSDFVPVYEDETIKIYKVSDFKNK